MKKLFKLFSVLLVLVMMTGCVKYDVDMKITDNKKMEINAIIASQSGVTEDTKSKFEKAGFKVEEYKDDNYTGIKISKTYANIDKVSSKDEVTVDLNKFLEGDEPTNFFKKSGNKYSAKFKFDKSSMGSISSDPVPENETEEPTVGATETETETEEPTIGTDTETEETTEETEDDDDDWGTSTTDTPDPEIILTVEAPKMTSSNADKKDGNKHIWDLYTHEGDVKFEFEAGKDSNLMLYIGIGAGVVVVALVLVLLLTKKGKKTPEAAPATPVETPVAPVAPVEPTPEPVAEEPKTE